MKMVIFDIDGTLLLTGGVGTIAFNRAFKEMYGFDDTWGDYDPHGKTDQQIVDEISCETLGYPISHLEKIELSRRYIQYFGELIGEAPTFRLMPGVLDLLEVFTRKNYFLGLATGNFRQTADHKLKRGGLNSFFLFGGYGSDSYDRLTLTRLALHRGLQMMKGKVKPEEVVLIGDARQDMECAKALKLRTIAVATGSLPIEELSKLKPDLLLENLSDLKRVTAFIES